MPLPKKDASIGERELAMAEQLIDGMMTDWEPAKYKDRYHGVVLKMIAEKARTGSIKSLDPKPKGAAASEVVDLLDLLKREQQPDGRFALNYGGPAGQWTLAEAYDQWRSKHLPA